MPPRRGPAGERSPRRSGPKTLNDGFVLTGKIVLKGDFSYTEDKAKVEVRIGKGIAD